MSLTEKTRTAVREVLEHMTPEWTREKKSGHVAITVHYSHGGISGIEVETKEHIR